MARGQEEGIAGLRNIRRNHRFAIAATLSIALSGGFFRLAYAQQTPATPAQGEAIFAKINGVAVPESDYVHTLEQITLAASENKTNAERFALDRIVTNQVILAEATEAGTIPPDDAVNAYYNYQRRLYEETMPVGKDYEATLQQQGSTPEEEKAKLKIQLAEMALYSKRMNITAADIHAIYDKANGQFGLPRRVLMRLILVAPNSADFRRAKKMLAAKTDFAEVAKTVNVPQLRGTSGLLPSYTMMNQISAPLQSQVFAAAPGDVIGPIDYKFAANQPPAKAWIKIEDKRPPYNITYDDAAPLICQQMVQMQIQQPKFAPIRNEIMQKKLAATFEPTDARYATVWNAIKSTAVSAGLGQPAAPEPPATADEDKPAAPLKAAFTAAPKTVHTGQTVTLTFTVTNPNSSEMTLSFASGKRFDITATAPKSGKVVWRASDGHMYPMMVGSLTLAAGEKKTFTASWPVGKVAPGTYALRAVLTSTSDDSSTPPVAASASATVASK